MPGMLQIITWLLSFYLVMKGVEILQIGLASNRSNRSGLIFIGCLSIAACVAVGAYLTDMQDKQAQSISSKVDSSP